MAKKTFKAEIEDSTNPAAAFISTAAKPDEKEIQKPETKSVRVNLLFRPTTKKNIEKLAHLDRTSLNDLISVVMEQYIADRSEDLEKYDRIFGGE